MSVKISRRIISISILVLIILILPLAFAKVGDTCSKVDEKKYDNGWIQCYEIDGNLIWKSQPFEACTQDTDCITNYFCAPGGSGSTCLLGAGQPCTVNAKWQCMDQICNWADGKGTCACAPENENINGKCTKKNVIKIGETSCDKVGTSQKDVATGLMMTCLSDGKDNKWFVGFGAECQETSQCKPNQECSNNGKGLQCLSKDGESCSADTNCIKGSKCIDQKCSNQVCQDGKKEGSEECDDNNDKDGDGCSKLCKVEEGYDCTDNNCLPIKCGDGKQQGSEECDDSNTVNDDGCSDKCKKEVCGDAIQQKNEECDNGKQCFYEVAGWGNEYCQDDSSCVNNGKCLLQDKDGCDSSCKLEPGFVCKEGKCTSTINCGNGKVDDSETCDDGNKDDGDGCDSICQLETGYACLKGKGKDQQIYLNSMEKIWSGPDSNLQKMSNLAKLIRDTNAPQKDTTDYCVLTKNEKELEVQQIILEKKTNPNPLDYLLLVIENLYNQFGK